MSQEVGSSELKSELKEEIASTPRRLNNSVTTAVKAIKQT